MSENLLLEVDSLLLERIRRYAKASGRTEREAIGHLLEHGQEGLQRRTAGRGQVRGVDTTRTQLTHPVQHVAEALPVRDVQPW